MTHGYKFLEGFASSRQALLRVKLAFDQPDLFDYISLKDLKVTMLPMVSAEDNLREASARRLCCRIGITAVESSNKPKEVRGTARYALIKQLLTLNINRRKSRVKFARRRIALDVWVGIISIILALGIAGKEEL